MRTLIVIGVFCACAKLGAQLQVSPGAVVGIRPGATVFVQNMDAENQGDISHAGDLTVLGNILNAKTWTCDPGLRSSISLTQNWTNNSYFHPGLSSTTFAGANQSIGGSAENHFYTLHFSGVAGDIKSMGSDLYCHDSLFLNEVEAATNGRQLSLVNAAIPVSFGAGFISTVNNGSVKTVFPSVQTGLTVLPLGYGPVTVKYRPVFIVDPARDSFSFTLYGHSPAAMGLNPYSLEDSICRLKDDHFYKVQSFGSPLFYGVTQSPAEILYTKLGRWSGSTWNKISLSNYSAQIPVQNLALDAQAASRTEYVALAQEKPYVDAGPELYLYMTESQQLVPTGYFPVNSSFTWDPVNYLDDHQIQDPVFTMGRPGKYTLKVNNGVGCEASDDVFIHILIPPLFMPNAFTPNNDNRNEGFGPVLGPGDTLENLIIYNRWGVKIYEGKNNWDGKYMNEMCPNDAYVYEMVILRTADVNSFRTVRKGTVNLMR